VVWLRRAGAGRRARELRSFAIEFGEVVRSLPSQLPENTLLILRAKSLTLSLCSSLDPEFNWGVALIVASVVPLMHAVFAGVFGRRGPGSASRRRRDVRVMPLPGRDVVA
jgi:hypothetical protein